MLNHTLHIQLSACEGAVLRALGLIERRGYRLGTCQVEQPGGDGRSMQVTVTSQRPGELLKRQLERLHDVVSVTLEQPAAQAARSYQLGAMGGSST